MRRALIGILVAATMATPVAAQISEESQERRGGFGARVRAVVENDGQPAERRQQRTERRQEQAEPRREQRQRRSDPSVQAPREELATERRRTPQARPGTWGESVNRAIVQEQREQREQRLERRNDRRDWRYGHRDDRDWHYDRRDDRDWRHDRRADRRDWDRRWRNDRRYDWQRYRTYNRSLFSVGRYYSPFYGHRYNRFSIGIRLGSPFYSDRYWIQDPWQYRLPRAYPGTRWVRYYDDVLLVDVYSGQVLDVIHDFFW